jgi:hypothetical protein
MLTELQYVCCAVSVTWDNECWTVLAEMPNGQATETQSHDVKEAIAEALDNVKGLQKHGPLLSSFSCGSWVG